jgi:hypothetical protein
MEATIFSRRHHRKNGGDLPETDNQEKLAEADVAP